MADKGSSITVAPVSRRRNQPAGGGGGGGGGTEYCTVLNHQRSITLKLSVCYSMLGDRSRCNDLEGIVQYWSLTDTADRTETFPIGQPGP